jgi:hypothetical protein
MNGVSDVAIGRLRGYSWALFGVASGVAGLLAIAGATLPSVWPVLLLGALIALSLNRLAFFPSEWSATAEVAVLAAAVVAFSGDGDAALLGPAVVACLCGPLDIVHWRTRSFWRMAYNSGNRALAALLAASVFAGVSANAATPVEFVAAALVASVVFALVDLFAFVGFEQLRGERSLLAVVREDLLLDRLTVPLGLWGAAAGSVATSAGWWVGALVLLPALFVPELVLVRARRLLRREQFVLFVGTALPTIVVSAAVVGAAAALTPLPSFGILVGLVTVAVGAGVELRVARRRPVAPVLAAVVAAAVVVGGHGAIGGAVVVAVVATAVSWLLARANGWFAPIVARGGAVAAAVVFDARSTRVGALAAALVFELVAVSRPSRIVWTAPVVGVAIGLAYTWRELGPAGGLAFGAGILAAGVVMAAWGALPWESRVLRHWSIRHGAGTHRVALMATVLVAAGLSLAAATVADERALFTSGATAAATTVAALAMIGVRQWRFAPRRRARDAAVVLSATFAMLLAYPPFALEGREWAPAILGVALAACSIVAWPIAARAEAAVAVTAERRLEDVRPR